MTWVVGLPSVFGNAVAISDVQVCWKNRTTCLDCLQKVYSVAPFLAAGFAGSVQIGFNLLYDLAQWIAAGLPPGQAVNTRLVACQWWRRARRIFAVHPRELRELGTEVLLAGVSPGERRGDGPWPRSEVIVLKSSAGFEPTYAGGMQCLSIGSGAGVVEYTAALEELYSLMSLEVSRPGGLGLALALRLSEVLRRNPVAGISRFLHITTAQVGQVSIQALNRSDISREGELVPDHMPSVARSMEEFNLLARSHGLSSAAAVA